MRKVLVWTLMVVVAMGMTVPAQAHKDGRPRKGHARCRQVWDGSRSIVKRRAATVRCWARERGFSPSGIHRIAICESGHDLQDFYDPYWSTFQHIRSYWSARAKAYKARGHAITDVWAQAKVSTGMMRREGFHHWPSCRFRY